MVRLRTEDERIAQEIAAAKTKGGLTGRLARYTLEAFNATRQPAAYRAALDFLQTPCTLVLHGPYGTGKTHLAAAIAHRFIEHDPVILQTGIYDPRAGRWVNEDGTPGGRALFVVLPDFLREARAAMGGREDETEADVVQRLQRSPLLVLDDVGRHKASRWAKETIYSIVNWRYNKDLPIIITTNLGPEDFPDMIGGGTTDRLIEMATMVPMGGPSFRIEMRS